MFEIFNKNSNFQQEKKVDLSSPIYFHFINGVVGLYRVSVAHYKMADMETYNSNIIMGNTQDQSVFHSIWCGSKVFDVSQRLRPQNPGRTDRKLDTLMCGKAKKADNGGIEQPKES
jgi:hypothetical protein